MPNEQIQKTDEVLILSPNIHHLRHFEYDKNFSFKVGFLTFLCLSIPNFKQKNQKKVMSQP